MALAGGSSSLPRLASCPTPPCHVASNPGKGQPPLDSPGFALRLPGAVHSEALIARGERSRSSNAFFGRRAALAPRIYTLGCRGFAGHFARGRAAPPSDRAALQLPISLGPGAPRPTANSPRDPAKPAGEDYSYRTKLAANTEISCCDTRAEIQRVFVKTIHCLAV